MSGVMFTANPQGILNESVIVIGYGRGDGVVEEKVPVTSYIIIIQISCIIMKRWKTPCNR